MYKSKLRELRLQNGYSQYQLAHISGVSFRMIQQYEEGHRDINGAKSITVWRLAKSLNCTMEDLVEPWKL